MKRSIKIIIITLLCVCVALPPQRTQAAVPLAILEIIKAGVKKVIKAIDLKIQRQQNKVIWLQNAQKVIENTMSKLRLDEISEWTEKQQEQYREYFDELRKVKMLISYYQRIRDITDKQVRLVQEYQRTWAIIRQDNHFSETEKQYMEKVYAGILNETVKNIDQLALVVNSFKTQMTDAKRLEIINQVGDRVDENYTDLRTFNKENGILSLQRAKSGQDIDLVRKLYGIE